MDPRTAQEIRREVTAAAGRDGALSVSELVNYLLSPQAAEGRSAPLHERAVRMAEAELQARASLGRSRSDYSSAAIHGYANADAQNQAILIMRDLMDAGVAVNASTHYMAQMIVTAADRRPMDRLISRFGL